MAKKPKGDEPKKEPDAPATEAVKPSETMAMPGEKKLRTLMNSARSSSKEVKSINGAYREKVGEAVEDHHLHPKAWAAAVKEDKMEGEDLADYYDHLDYYRDVLGLNKRAEDATKNMDFGAGKEGEETEDKDEDDGKVTKFPAQTATH